jgi:siroheme synthase-like protein
VSNFRASAAMLLCVLCWSTSGLFIKLIDWHPMVISCVRSAIAALFMAAVYGRSMFARPLRPVLKPAIFGISALPVAALASAATKILYVTANKLTSPANAILLQHTAPVWVALAGCVFLGERPRKTQWIALALAGGGIVIFFSGGVRSGGLAGDAAALLAGVSFALGMVALRSLKDGTPALALFCSHLITAAAGLPFLFTNTPHVTVKSMGAVVFLGLVQIGAASLLYSYAIKRLPAIKTALLSQIEPVLNPAWVFLFTRELPSRYAISGGILIIAAALIDHIQEAPPLKPHAPVKHGFFPLFISVSGKRALVIGGGTVSLRRARTLLQFDCAVHVIAEKLRPELAALAEQDSALTLEQRAFCPGDCIKDGQPVFVIAATNRRAVNHAVAEECAAYGIPVSVADSKEESTFYFPAIAIRGIIIAGISSDGRDHKAVRDAAAKIREVLHNDDTNRDP